jgi:DNA topoisomerase-1
MAKSLVIVESPAKARTINKYLGKDYVVKSSVGHIRDLPTSGNGKKASKKVAKKGSRKRLTPAEKAKKERTALVRKMGVNPDREWDAQYEILPGKEKVVNELQRLAASADEIYLATDLDREGEAIAWHLREAIGGDDSRYKRVVFSEITKRAIQAAFEKPGSLNMDRVNAQQARRFLDRIVGYMVSPLLWKKVARGLSAGRVQSVAVKLIVEREREIHKFNPVEYWKVHADLGAGSGPFRAIVHQQDGSKFEPGSQEETDAALAILKPASYRVAEVETKPKKTRPMPPLITSTLQAAASTRLGFAVKRTMRVAQQLYEAGYITYMRTDSTNLSGEAIGSCRSFIESTYGPKYLPEKAQVYTPKKGAQEAHEAIRPTDVNLTPERFTDLDKDAQRLYGLIWSQFVACQMPPALYDGTTIKIEAGPFELRATGRVLRFDGFTRVMKLVAKKDEDIELPEVQEGEVLDLKKLDPSQHFTKPPARFSEAALVRELEKRGIGRPSTYAAIISTIQERGYVRLDKRRFFAEKMGEIVTDRLNESFADLMAYEFTSDLETRLDEIAEGDVDWKSVLDEFFRDFEEKLAAADESMRPNAPTETDIECSACGRNMLIRTGRTGVFLGCSGYALPPKERCTNTMNLTPGEETVNAEDPDEQEAAELRAKRRCRLCDTAMDSYLVDEKRRLHVCGNNPDCPGFEIEEGTFKIKGYEGPTIECDKCGSEMQLKVGRFGKYFGCTKYPECKNTRKLLRNGEPAPPKADPVPMPELPCEKGPGHFVLRDGAAGIFLASSEYPRSRETRAPKVSELAAHRAELDPKFHFLADGPQKDDKGRPTLVRFARKTKTYYLMSEDDKGKASGWNAFYRGGKWQVEIKAKKPARKAAKKKTTRKKSTA